MTVRRIRLALLVLFLISAGTALCVAAGSWHAINAEGAREGYSRLQTFRLLGLGFFLGSDNSAGFIGAYVAAVLCLLAWGFTFSRARKVLAYGAGGGLLLLALLYGAAHAQAAPSPDDGWRPAPASSTGDDSWMRYGPGGALGPFSPACPAVGGVELRVFYTFRGHRVPLWVGDHWPEWIHSRPRRFDASGDDVWMPAAQATWLPCRDTRWTTR